MDCPVVDISMDCFFRTNNNKKNFVLYHETLNEFFDVFMDILGSTLTKINYLIIKFIKNKFYTKRWFLMVIIKGIEVIVTKSFTI